ncbi:hypothetical protein JXA31_02355 [Candidatus Bathyarchaeota archaeon]|nr:hypothetical protein [Candidatus Bathyarchaeota archaeon]
MTETINAEPVVISAETPTIKENIVDRKTIVYEAHIDPTVIRVSGEKLKQQLFTRFGLFKPKSEEIQFISLDKYYEPYIVISGKYFLDYYRKCTYVFKVDERVREVVLLNHKFMPETSKSSRIIKLNGEERLIKEAKAFLILDKNGSEATVDHLPSAPSEKKPEKVISEFKIEELAENVDVNFVRERIAERPKDVSRIMEEVFEITDRSVIYTPRFKLLFKNVKTGEEKVMVLDGVTSKKM